MKVSVNSPKTPVTKGSSGIAAATVPNVCKMPGPPAPFVPVPLPNIGQSNDSPKGYTKKVKVEGKIAAIKGATFKSKGDVASKGTGGGLVSSNTHGPTKFVGPGSFDVKFEGKNVQFLGDPMLNNCGGSGNPPNSATLLGVLQGPLMVVVEGGDKCPVCDEAPHGDLAESEATKADAASIEADLRAAGFPSGRINMLAVAYCLCETDKAAARSTTRDGGKFSEVAAGYLTPKYADYGKSSQVLDKMRELAPGLRTETAIGVAAARRKAFDAVPKAKKPTTPQVNVPGSCAAPRAVLLLLENGGLPGAITERWCGGGEMKNPVSHIRVDDEGVRTQVDDHKFQPGDSVPPCMACDALLPVLLCTKDKQCH